MIEQYFPSKRAVVPPYKYTPPVVYQHPLGTSAPSAFESARAEKMGLTTEVYRQRVTEVSRAQADCRFMVGDTVYPVNDADCETYGACQVVGVCRHYHDYGSVAWNTPPLILSVQPIKDRGTTLNTTANWVVRKKPVLETENYGDC